jgi:hypothetical protein
VAHRWVFCEIRTPSTYRKVNLCPKQDVETHRRVSCEVHTSTHNKSSYPHNKPLRSVFPVRYHHHLQTNKETNSVASSPHANYTDWSNATSWRNLVPTFPDTGLSRGQDGESLAVVNLSFLDRSRYFSSSNRSSSFTLTRAEWTPFQTQCYSENLAAPGMEPGTRPQRRPRTSSTYTKVKISQ